MKSLFILKAMTSGKFFLLFTILCEHLSILFCVIFFNANFAFINLARI